jgi:antitoxin component of MazEF toxin-antitoxin module
MKISLNVTEDRNLLIPPDLAETLHLKPGASVEVEIGEVKDPEPYRFDQTKFDAAIQKFAGSVREEMLADGYSSVDEMMDDIRPKW